MTSVTHSSCLNHIHLQFDRTSLEMKVQRDGMKTLINLFGSFYLYVLGDNLQPLVLFSCFESFFCVGNVVELKFVFRVIILRKFLCGKNISCLFIIFC